MLHNIELVIFCSGTFSQNRPKIVTNCLTHEKWQKTLKTFCQHLVGKKNKQSGILHVCAVKQVRDLVLVFSIMPLFIGTDRAILFCIMNPQSLICVHLHVTLNWLNWASPIQ